ncbi:MAG: GHMP kinase, partial [Clostridia bacterium]|nr:GHMP kinase [Clostridia bacterium]
FFSGLERSLVSSGYNKRVDECKEAARQLLGFAGLPRKDVSQTLLSDVPYEVFQTYKSKLPQNLALRAEHWFGECERVTKGIEAWENGDIESFGELVFESGYSSIHNYEAGSPELIRLYEIMQETDGIYGGRFSGAGFKGCCFALIDPEKKDTILERVRSEYLTAFPDLKDKYSACICHPADGVGNEEP